ncbi:DUF2867 domain-containing protein [Bradyrhizobium sp. CNPSo 4010]|uniref:DUF2867 domain-containing protein n=1 Tax=Bradyrhizobium agreste TaxID=2751811 RepID=A0ABS0PK17_9BRAD|nr:DUF2867 domain-containing protein [Bradyrhizobium agreste]MBH5397548.1 DUF2867 domain-containing protein [Bradyrhizobium agreste]
MAIATSTKIPVDSRLAETFAQPAWFQDAHRAPLSVWHETMPELFFAIFGHHPSWMKTMLIARNRLAARWGLEVPADDEILAPPLKSSYAVGDRIGPWPIFALEDNEIIAGRDNRHLDFRVSILRTRSGSGNSVTVTTVCRPHNIAGKAYLVAVAPFHIFGMRWLLADAVRMGRI